MNLADVFTKQTGMKLTQDVLDDAASKLEEVFDLVRKTSANITNIMPNISEETRQNPSIKNYVMSTAQEIKKILVTNILLSETFLDLHIESLMMTQLSSEAKGSVKKLFDDMYNEEI